MTELDLRHSVGGEAGKTEWVDTEVFKKITNDQVKGLLLFYLFWDWYQCKEIRDKMKESKRRESILTIDVYQKYPFQSNDWSFGLFFIHTWIQLESICFFTQTFFASLLSN